MRQYTAINVSLTNDPFNGTTPQGTQTVGASTTSAISKEFPITYGGSKNILVGVRVTAQTTGSGITLKLQSSLVGSDDNEGWIDGNTASVTATGWYYIRMNVENTTDQAIMPLASIGRVVAVNAAGASVTVAEVMVCQSL